VSVGLTSDLPAVGERAAARPAGGIRGDDRDAGCAAIFLALRG
jgi:hypothetical protein